MFKVPFFYFEVCTLHLVQFIMQTNKCTTYIYLNILYIVSFDAAYNIM